MSRFDDTPEGEWDEANNDEEEMTDEEREENDAY